MTDLTQTLAWRALEAHAEEAVELSIADMVENEPGRIDRMAIDLQGILFDFSKHLVSAETLEFLCELAQQQDVQGNFTRMMRGDLLNTGEGRAAMHTALRNPNPSPDVLAALNKIRAVSDNIRADKTIKDVVHIGVGGSDLGPRLVCDALGNEATSPRVHFVGNADPDDLNSVLQYLKPSETVFIIASKTFTTRETVLNMNAAKAWLGGDMRRMLAATAHVDAARAEGFIDANIIPFWDWVGGRFSLWSSVGTIIAIAYGYDVFENLLAGAHDADRHVQQAPYKQNVPVLMALLSVWYRNFLGCDSHAVLPYSHRLTWLAPYVQQLEMESNGKSANRAGDMIAYATAPVIFGGVGTNAQHAFMQILYQGADLIPADFIGVATPEDGPQRVLMANMLAQSRSLMLGSDGEGHRAIPGNMPSSTIVLPVLDAYHLGVLLAVLEHKTAAEGFLWDINSFDQFGVELGKIHAKELLAPLSNLQHNKTLDKSTNKLIFHTFNAK